MARCSRSPVPPSDPGKIERGHQLLKSRIRPEDYYLPRDLEIQIGAFIRHFNHMHYHESFENPTPAEVYFGRAVQILAKWERIKRQTIRYRRLLHQKDAA